MNSKLYAQVLDWAVEEKIPETVNIAPRVLALVTQERRNPMQPKLKLITTIFLVILTVLVLTTAAYAVYRLLGDPGLQSVQDAGLVTDLNVTAQPTLLPANTPASTALPASNLALSQTLEGVTLTFDWVYLDEGRLALGWKFNDLPEDTILDTPKVTFIGVTPVQSQGYSQSIRSDEKQAVYVSYQVIHADSVGGKVDMSVEVPLVKHTGEEQTTLASFHFNLTDVPVYKGQTISIQQTYAVRRNGVEVRLKSVRVMPSNTEITACYDFPTQNASFWYMQHATVQIGDGPEESYRPYQYLSDIQDDHCVKLGFAVGNASGENRLIFRVRQLVVPLTMQDELPPERIEAANRALEQYGIEIKPAPSGQSEGPGGWQFVRKPDPGTDPSKDPSLLVLQALQEKMDGPWEFTIDIPQQEIVPVPGQEQSTLTPAPVSLGSQTLDGVTMTLDWVFADAKRVAFGYTIRGMPDQPDALTLSGSVKVKDGQGQILGENGGASAVDHVPGQPGVVSGYWSALVQSPLTQPAIQLSIDLTLDGSGGANYNNIIAEFPRAYTGPAFPPDYVPPVYPDRLIGSYHFDATTTVYPMQIMEPKQSVVINGLEMQLEKVEATPSYAKFVLCYRKPSSADWMIGSKAVLKSGNYETSIYGYSLLSDSGFGLNPLPGAADVAGETGGRCVSIDFLLGYSQEPGPMVLTIPSLEQSIPEVIPDADIQAAREKLKTQGIELEYTTYHSAGGGGGGGPTFSKLPEGMDPQEAYMQFMEALGYVFTGPWSFEIRLP